MGLPDTFLQFVVAMGASMTMPTLTSLVTVVQGWLKWTPFFGPPPYLDFLPTPP